jgi:hypothetical protein
MDNQVNRKLFLQHEVYEIFPREKIQETIVYFESVKKEIDERIVVLTRMEDMLRAVNQDSLEISEHIRILEIQKVYLNENIETFKDALSLSEDSIN